jgi:hypothetical protein
MPTFGNLTDLQCTLVRHPGRGGAQFERISPTRFFTYFSIKQIPQVSLEKPKSDFEFCQVFAEFFKHEISKK